MATLRKSINATTSGRYFVAVESGIDIEKSINSYSTDSPETDVIVQLLAYAYYNDWRINQYDTRTELMRQLENHLTEDELLEIADMNRLNEHIDELSYQINSIAPHGIYCFIIEKDGDEYTLDVDEDDIHKIFLDLI